MIGELEKEKRSGSYVSNPSKTVKGWRKHRFKIAFSSNI